MWIMSALGTPLARCAPDPGAREAINAPIVRTDHGQKLGALTWRAGRFMESAIHVARKLGGWLGVVRLHDTAGHPVIEVDHV